MSAQWIYLRATAEAAAEVRPGRWKTWGMDVLSDPKDTSDFNDAKPVARTSLLIDGKPRTHLCDFIAAANPTAVLALLDRLDVAEERLSLAADALVATGYFTTDEVGPDVAPRITEAWSATRAEAAQ